MLHFLTYHTGDEEGGHQPGSDNDERPNLARGGTGGLEADAETAAEGFELFAPWTGGIGAEDVFWFEVEIDGFFGYGQVGIFGFRLLVAGHHFGMLAA